MKLLSRSIMSILLSLLLLLALPASTALAAEDISLDPDEGEIGERIDITGDGFNESYYNTDIDYHYYYVDIYFASVEADEGDDIDDEVENYERVKSGLYVDEYGEFDSYFDVPEELTDGDEDEIVGGGTYYVYVTYDDDTNIEAVAEFTVIAGEIELDVDEGQVGTELSISGTDFSDDEEITIEFDDEELAIESGDYETDRDGEFESTVIIPESTAGEHIITVTDESGGEAEATFTVEPEIAVTPSDGSSGETVTVKGTGFGGDMEVIIEFDGDEIASHTTDDYGSFERSFTLPAKSSGAYEIAAEDEEGNQADASLNIASNISLTPMTGNVGTQISVSGTGFPANQPVTVTYDQQTVGTGTTDSNGIFAPITFKATHTQNTHTANHPVAVSSGATMLMVNFVMESQAPPKPTLSAPAHNTRVGIVGNQAPTFEWSTVTDPSGVLYDLQIAAGADCAQPVLSKTGLSESSYTLSKIEALPYGTYYWRVRAVDGAQNTGDWSNVYSFDSGFLPLWAFIVIIVVVAVLIGVLVYFFGVRRRSAYD